MATPTSKRTPPARRLRDYVIHRIDQNEASLTDVPEGSFTQIPGTEYNASSPATYFDTVSSPIDIGFEFSFNDVTYRRVVVSPCGWLVLCDPAGTPPTAPSDVGMTNGYDAAGITYSGDEHVVISPWLSRLRGLMSSYTTTNALATRIKYGYEPPPPHLGFDERRYGVQYSYAAGANGGRRFVVRWNAVTDPDASRNMYLVRFDCVIYESGRIEMRYSRRNDALPVFADVVAGSANQAACLVFALKAGNDDFRDLSRLLGYQTSRQEWTLGGNVYDAGYTDPNGASFVTAMTYANNWRGGAVVMQPPANRRRINRSYVSRLSDKGRQGGASTLIDVRSNEGTYNDVNTLLYVTQSIDLTVGLRRGFANGTIAALERHDVFGTNGNVTASSVVSRAASEGWLSQQISANISPFDERSTTDPSSSFYLSGSSPDLYRSIVTGELRQKKRIDLEFGVNYRTTLLPMTSTIHYLDPNVGQWRMPPNSTSISTSTSSIGNSDIELVPNDVDYFTAYDGRGFDSIGQFFTSMSFSVKATGLPDGTYRFSYQNMSTLISGSGESITMSRVYDGNPCTFELPIQSDMLLEKMELTVPLEIGPGWFGDKTLSGQWDLSFGCPDQGGPALTFVLMHEQQNSDVGVSRRAIIMSGTLTHQLDTVQRVVLINTGSDPMSYAVEGFSAYATPAAVVPALTASTFFTGSVTLQLEAATSAGPTVTYREGSTIGSGQLRSFLSRSALRPDFLVRLNPFGRAKNGFNVDTSSPFGKEFAGIGPTYRNIFSPIHGTDVSAFETALQISGSDASYTATSVFSLSKNVQSPYLLKPGSRLILAVAKTRPWGNTTYSTLQHLGYAPLLPDRYSPHDIKLGIGTVKASFFGTQLTNERERLTSLDQQLDTNAVHTVIGNEPVIDQCVGSYRSLYQGTMRDDYVTGTMVERSTTSKNSLVTGSRGRVFSKLNAQLYQPNPIPLLNVYGYDSGSGLDYVLTGSDTNPNTLSTLSRPNYLKAGTVRVMAVNSPTERYYDSMLPRFSECTAVNGGRILKRQTFGHEPYENTVFLDTIFLGTSSITGNNSFVDINWLRTFPFEPRYANVTRTRTIDQGYTSKFSISGSAIVSSEPFTSRTVYVFTEKSRSLGGVTIYVANDIVGYYSASIFGAQSRTVGMNLDDTTRLLFGFGDMNTVHDLNELTSTDLTPYGGRIHGVHNAVEFHCGFSMTASSGQAQCPYVRGWRYGLLSGFPTFTKAYFRTDRYGQNRDMLEQRQDARFVNEDTNSIVLSPVSIKFLDAQGRITLPENTMSQNLSLEATSSAPYTDGRAVQRTDINTNVVNRGILSLKANEFGNATF